MDFLIKLIVEFFIRLTMKSENVKTRTKTILFLVVCVILDALTGFYFYEACFVDHDFVGSVLSGAVLLYLLGITIFGTISGHRWDWK